MRMSSRRLKKTMQEHPVTVQPKKKEEKPQVKEEPKREIVFADEVKKEAKPMPTSPDAESIKPLKAWSEAVQTVEPIDNGAYAFLKKICKHSNFLSLMS